MSSEHSYSDTKNESYSEGPVAKSIEQFTAKMPSDIFLWAAAASVAGALALQVIGMKHRSLFVGQWVPSILLLGVYNKIVKTAGSDRSDTQVLH